MVDRDVLNPKRHLLNNQAWIKILRRRREGGGFNWAREKKESHEKKRCAEKRGETF